MALRIIVPSYLDTKGQNLLSAALQNFGAQHITVNEWRFSQIPLSGEKFVAELKVFLPGPEQWLADRLTVTIFHR